ncbi:unnamed protein product [Amoebophrya sp. A25]|nr:unnamed protein product [Amoebophrya sp. A25]|eukprot:GSA25T00012293001.1
MGKLRQKKKKAYWKRKENAPGQQDGENNQARADHDDFESGEEQQREDSRERHQGQPQPPVEDFSSPSGSAGRVVNLQTGEGAPLRGFKDGGPHVGLGGEQEDEDRTGSTRTQDGDRTAMPNVLSLSPEPDGSFFDTPATTAPYRGGDDGEGYISPFFHEEDEDYRRRRYEMMMNNAGAAVNLDERIQQQLHGGEAVGASSSGSGLHAAGALGGEHPQHLGGAPSPADLYRLHYESMYQKYREDMIMRQQNGEEDLSPTALQEAQEQYERLEAEYYERMRHEQEQLRNVDAAGLSRCMMEQESSSRRGGGPYPHGGSFHQAGTSSRRRDNHSSQSYDLHTRRGHQDSRQRGGQDHEDYDSSSEEETDSDDDSRSSSQYTSSKCSHSGDEDNPKAYKKGGYHPVVLGQQYAGRYRILSKLGAGAFSTVWLCADERNDDILVAMKICKSKSSVSEQALDEIALLRCISEPKDMPNKEYCMPLKHHFWHMGPNGKHMCLIFELLGENLLALVKYTKYGGLPLSWVRKIARQVLQACDHLAKVGVIHTDIKLENVCVHRHDMAEVKREAYAVLEALKAAEKQFHDAELRRKQAHHASIADSTPPQKLSKAQKKKMLLKKKKLLASQVDMANVGSGSNQKNIHEIAHPDIPEEERIKLPDAPIRQKTRFETFSLADLKCVLSDFGNGCWVDKHFTEEIQTRQYRAPEVLIGAPYDTSTDLWSSACMFFELLTGDFLFDPKSSNSWSTDEDQLALMVELLGDFPPPEWLFSSKHWDEFFQESGDRMIHIRNLQFWPMDRVLHEKYKFSEEDSTLFADFLLSMLRWRPEDRVTAEQALLHPFLQGEDDMPDDQNFMNVKEDSASDREGHGHGGSYHGRGEHADDEDSSSEEEEEEDSCLEEEDSDGDEDASSGGNSDSDEDEETGQSSSRPSEDGRSPLEGEGDGSPESPPVLTSPPTS